MCVGTCSGVTSAGMVISSARDGTLQNVVYFINGLKIIVSSKTELFFCNIPHTIITRCRFQIKVQDLTKQDFSLRNLSEFDSSYIFD